MSVNYVSSKFLPGSGKKVISFSVYGDKPVYLLGAERNVEVAKEIYPDWVCRFYCGAEISNLEKLKSLDCEVLVVDSKIPPMYWRFLAADDPNVSAFVSRDTDSLVNSREKAAVDEWLLSDKIMHTMHDNLAGHWSPVMGGMWGIKTPIEFNMTQELLDYTGIKNFNFTYSDDQSFLSSKLLTRYGASCIDHHNKPESSIWNYSVKFPEHKSIEHGGFVGDRISAFGFKKDDYKNFSSDRAFIVSHLGPMDHFEVRHVIQSAINLYKEVVIPCKAHSLSSLNFMFGGYDNVRIETVLTDDSCFILYEGRYSSTHKFIGLGMHGDKIPGTGWGVNQASLQSGLPIEASNLFYKSLGGLDYNDVPAVIKSSFVASTELPPPLPVPSLPTEVSSASLNPFLSLAANESLTPVNEVFEPTKVSVIIPTYNRFSFLLNSLSSVKSQTYKNLEVIIINDASTEEEYYNYDFKENFGDNFHILHLPKNSRSIHGKVAGGGHARNIAMMLSDAKYVAFLDDDDQFLPNKLEVQVKYLENSDCKISCTEALCGSGPMDTNKAYDNWHYNGAFWNSLKSIFSAVGKSENLDQMFNGDTNIWTEEDILTHNCCICSTVMIDRSVLDQAGYFPLKPSAEDWAYWKKILKHTNCLYIREPLSYMDSSHGDGQLWL